MINNLSTNCSKSVAKELLILIGDKKSGKDILCQNIIEPIIGREFCLNMDEEILNSKNAEKKLKNKLMNNIVKNMGVSNAEITDEQRQKNQDEDKRLIDELNQKTEVAEEELLEIPKQT